MAKFTPSNRSHTVIQDLVTHPTGQFPNESYLNGLRDNPEATLAVVYDEFRLPVVRALVELGSSETEGVQFFQWAVNDAVHLANTGTLPADIPFYYFLRALSLAHYRDYAVQNGQELPDDIPEPVLRPDATPAARYVPQPEALRATRNRISVWQGLEALEPECRHILLAAPEEDAALTDESFRARHLDECQEKLLREIQTINPAAMGLPAETQEALQNRQGYAIWQRTQVLESEWTADQPTEQESNRIWRWAVAALLLVAVGYGAYQFFFRPKTAAEVFADNFAPPASLMEDLEARYGAEMGNDSVTAQPGECMLLLREADAYYRAKEFQSAVDPLLLIVLDSFSICQSDAWYFLGIIQLQLEDPATAIQCFAKIEDLNRYGEDLYWYQALAFVQLAKENPLMRDKAHRAVARALGNTRDPKRRQQAEQMLDNLAK